jgi:MFS family permease
MSHGWFVVACAFLVALCGFGFGFYGPGLYLVTLRAAHGWPIALLSSAVSVYYLCAALGTVFVGDAMGRFGPRPVVVVGSIAMSLGIGWLTVVQTLGQVYAAFVVMSVGWAAMSGAAVSTMVAPWFEERRGLAISLALNGGSCGGILVTPLLIFLIVRYGFRRGMWLALAGMMAVLLPSVWWC